MKKLFHVINSKKDNKCNYEGCSVKKVGFILLFPGGRKMGNYCRAHVIKLCRDSNKVIETKVIA